MNALRLPFAGSMGGLITAALFTVLWMMVAKPVLTGYSLTTTRIEFTRLIEDSALATKAVRRDKPERPPSPVFDQTVRIAIEPPARVRDPRPVNSGLPGDRTGRDGIGAAPQLRSGFDGDAQPNVRVLPQYPLRAAENGIEGWVRVQFDVTSEGTVRNARVVGAEPRGTFDDAALAAVQRWRYSPRTMNGTPVESVGLQTIMYFELEQ